MSGWYRMRRGWQSHPFFPDEPFTEREAWEWLIGNAAWKSTARRGGKGDLIPIQRGQLHVSDRSLAAAWKWDKKHVRRFLERLERGEMVDRQKDHSGTVLTIRNYEAYQVSEKGDGPTLVPPSGPTKDQPRTTQEERKEGEEGKGGRAGARDDDRYAFSGRTIRLNAADLGKWRATYSAIPDLAAELTAIDGWFQSQSEADRKGWFHRVPQMLNRKHQEALAARKAAESASAGQFAAFDDYAARKAYHARRAQEQVH